MLLSSLVFIRLPFTIFNPLLSPVSVACARSCEGRERRRERSNRDKRTRSDETTRKRNICIYTYIMYTHANRDKDIYIYIYIYLFICICIYVCMCMIISRDELRVACDSESEKVASLSLKRENEEWPKIIEEKRDPRLAFPMNISRFRSYKLLRPSLPPFF